MTTDPKADATVVSELTRLADGNIPVIKEEINGRLFFVHRNDITITERTLPNNADVVMPKVANCGVSIDTAASLIDYVNRFKNPDTVLFANEEENAVTAVIDYHKAAAGEAPVEARLGVHQATLTLAYSDQWETWMERDEQLMRHVSFATFLEENQWDVAEPRGADLLEICRDLQVKESMNFSSSIRMGDTVSVTYEKDGDVSTKSSMSLPAQFELFLPVYFGEPSVRVLCFTRRSVDGGRLSLGYKMSRREYIERMEFARIVEEIRAGVGGLTTIYGRR